MRENDYGDDLAVAYDEEAAKKERDKAMKKVKTITQKAVKAFGGKVKDAADIAIFGRMVADDHSLMVEGAGLFSHALSTHGTANEIDFFSAVDDKNPMGDAGAGHIGTLEFNSACYYRYVGLNLDMLKDGDHLGALSEDELKTVVDGFLRAAILAVPAARKNSMFGHNPPAYVLGVHRTGQPLSLVNAFETPVQSSAGYVDDSIAALNTHWNMLADTYGLRKQLEAEATIPDSNLDEFISKLT
jgi:CRISPR system Cascade subunit CasC